MTHPLRCCLKIDDLVAKLLGAKGSLNPLSPKGD